MPERPQGASEPCFLPQTTAKHAYSSHLMGFFYRTIRMVENGIKPAYVFDGKPPELKSGVVSPQRIPPVATLLILCTAVQTFRETRRSKGG